MLIVIEGADGAGKTTVAKRVAEWLGGDYFPFPNRDSPTGRRIDDMLKGRTTFDPVTFQALQVVNRLEVFGKLSKSGTFFGGKLILDRYWQSGVVYGEGDGLDAEYIRTIQHTLPNAGMSILLDVDSEVAMQRMIERGGSPEMYEKRSEHFKTARRYRKLWEKEGKGFDAHRWIVVDANQPVDRVVTSVLAEIAKR